MCAQSGLEGCASAREATSVSSLRNAAHMRCLGVSSAGWASAARSGCGICLGLELDEADLWGISGWVWCSSDARRTGRLELLAMIPGSSPTRLKATDATVFITILSAGQGRQL